MATRAADGCYACQKANCEHCLGQVVTDNADVIGCPCEDADHEECESCGQLLADPADCDHKQLCTDCSNECRICMDTAAREETLERRAG